LHLLLSAARDGSDLGRRMGTAALIEVLIDQGDLPAAHASADDTDAADLAAPGYSGSIPLLRSLAALALADGDPRRALDLAERCGRQARELDYDAPGWSSWRSVAVPAHWMLGEADRARSLAEEERVRVEPTGTAIAIGAATRLLGEVADDTALLREAVALLAPASARLEYARALVALGAALRRSGALVEARETLARGRDVAVRCGAIPLIRTADLEVAAAGGRRRATEPNTLTASERRVCELASEGLANRLIAQRLFVSTKTVETHLSRAYRKLGIAGRAELAGALVG
jgi:DNA-binding CsgD family transcriptional regulator